MTQSPVNERLTISAAVPEGRFIPNGLRCFVNRFSTPASMAEFLKWRENPTTVAYLAALRTLAVSPPAAYVNQESVKIQFGVQSGVALALSLAEDPTALYPSMFMGATSGAGQDPDGLLHTEYSVAPDALAKD